MERQTVRLEREAVVAERECFLSVGKPGQTDDLGDRFR